MSNVRHTKPTARKTAAKKIALAPRPTTAKPLPKAPPVNVPEPAKLRSTWQLLRLTGQQFWRWKKPLIGIAAIYWVLTVILAQGLSTASSNSGNLTNYSQMLSNIASDSSGASGVWQIVLFVVVSLALIWALRQLMAGNAFRFRDAYYRGMYPLVPFSLMLLLASIQALPLALGSGLFAIMIQNTAGSWAPTIIIATVIVVGLMLVSIYWWTRTLLALYIATLPDTPPRKAYELARDLASGRRWTIARKIICILLLLAAGIGILLLPAALAVPALAPFILSILIALAVVLLHTFMFNLYRELMHEPAD